MDYVKLLEFLASHCAPLGKMFNEYIKRRRFTDLSETACSLIIDAIEKREHLIIDGDGVLAERRRVVESGGQELIAELKSYSLVKSFGGFSYVPTCRARRRLWRLREIKYDYLKKTIPNCLYELFTTVKIAKGGAVELRFQAFSFPGRTPDVEICATVRTRKEVKESCIRVEDLGALFEFLRKEELADNWRVGNVRHTFTTPMEEWRILAILNNPAKKPLAGAFTKRAARFSRALKKKRKAQ